MAEPEYCEIDGCCNKPAILNGMWLCIDHGDDVPAYMLEGLRRERDDLTAKLEKAVAALEHIEAMAYVNAARGPSGTICDIAETALRDLRGEK